MLTTRHRDDDCGLPVLYATLAVILLVIVSASSGALLLALVRRLLGVPEPGGIPPERQLVMVL